MLTRVLHNSPQLPTFIDQLDLKLSAPQRRRVINVAEGVLVTDASKTLAEIQRQFVSCVDPSNIADSFRIPPWTAENIRVPLSRLMIQPALTRLRQQSQPYYLLSNIDSVPHRFLRQAAYLQSHASSRARINGRVCRQQTPVVHPLPMAQRCSAT